MLIRFFDIILSGLALVALSPLLFPVVLLLKVTGEGEVFFLQDRVGKSRKLFKLYKFATMLKNSPNIGTGTVTMKNDPRVLPVGLFLRKTKINELPQLVNVLCGDMSLIGPRPQAKRCFDAFPAAAQEILVRIKPGLSGVGPIVFRNEEKILDGHAGNLDFYDSIIGPYKGEVEAWYVSNYSLKTYLSLILLTIWVVVIPHSDVVWRFYRDLPAPPLELKSYLRYPF